MLATITTGGLVLAAVLTGASGASAYAPSAQTVYSTNGSSCNKSPCVLYPKTAQLPSGRVIAAFEDSEGTVAGQMLPIYKSDDSGDSWQKLTNLKPPSQLTSDSTYASWTSNWTNPYFYVLPQAFGGMAAGTLILADVVSSSVAGSNDRPQDAIVLYASSDEGATWKVLTTVASTTDANTDALWEPYVMLYKGQLVVYYSDDNDYLSYDTTTGAPKIDPANATNDPNRQVLLHKTWTGSGAWSSAVVDVAGTTGDVGGGKTEIGGGNPGMTNVVPTTDGKWLLTYEYWGGGDNVRYKVADDPLRFFTVSDGAGAGTGISALPVASGSSTLTQGGSPVLERRPDGSILYNAANSGDVWINESGSSTGAWKEYHTSIGAGYSRSLQYLATTGQVLIMQAPWGSGPVSSATVDFGNSVGTYYTLVNRATGQVLAPSGGRTQDAQFTGNAADIGTQNRNGSTSGQWWHLAQKNGSVTLLNRAGGRALGIWGGKATSGATLAQWVDDNAADKTWTLVRASDGYVRLRASADATLAVTGSSSGSVDLEKDSNAAAQQWQLVIDPTTTASSTFAVTNAKSGKVLGINQGSVADGAQAVQWTSNGAADQSWTVTSNSDGSLRFTSSGSGKTLGVLGASTSPGAKVVQWSSNGAADQQWSWTGAGPLSGLKNAGSGLVLGVSGGSTADGADAVQWSDTGAADQQWQLVQTSAM